MTAENEGDKALLLRVSTGDSKAMQRLFERHHDRLYGFIQGRCSDPALVADVVQDTMLEVWRSASKFRGGASVKTWIFTIARNKLIDRNRKAERVTYTDEIPDTEDNTPNPEAVLASVQEAGRVRACLSKLKESQQSIIRLAFYEGLTYSEIAKVEGIPQGTVKTRIMHAKKALMRCLGHR